MSEKQFGAKINELFTLVENVDDWQEYVSQKTALIILVLYQSKDLKGTMDKFDMKYSTLRSHLLRAIERIQKRKKDHLHNGESINAKELFKLMEKPNWTQPLTPHEVLVANQFKKLKNLYQVGRELNIKPSNIAATLYGNTQKLGILKKLEKLEKLIENKDKTY